MAETVVAALTWGAILIGALTGGWLVMKVMQSPSPGAEQLLKLRKRARLYALVAGGFALPYVILGVLQLYRARTAVPSESVDPAVREQLRSVGTAIATNCFFTALAMTLPLTLAFVSVAWRARRPQV